MKTRIIKQVVNSKGKITKDSYVIKPLSYEDTLCKCQKARRVVKPVELDVENNFLAWDMFLTLRKQLKIRNLIILVLIVINLLSWR